MYIILMIILIVLLISLLVASIAFVFDRIEQYKSDHKPYGPYERFIKRPLDAFLSTAALFIFSPILLITAVFVFVKFGTPIIFIQERPGRDGKVFNLYKFRSMTNEKDENGNLLPDKQRLTRFGKILRATSLDELPELVNIIKGDMSIIGPRPLLVKYLNRYHSHDARRHEVRPGLTGLAQSSGRNTLTWKEKFILDVEYVDHLSFMMDVKILVQTIRKVIRKEGIEFTEGHQSVMEYFDEQDKQEKKA